MIRIGDIKAMYENVHRIYESKSEIRKEMYTDVHHMSAINLNRAFRELAKQGGWAVSEATLRLMLGQSVNTFRVQMKRTTQAGDVQRLAPGLYQNPFLPAPAWALERLAARLRPDDFFYVSLESALSEYGRISQLPTRLTLVTTGSPYLFETPLGVIEFNRGKRSFAELQARLTFAPERKIYFASEALALEDLQIAGRNLDLVLPEEED
ncbi:type IV toxin-antitoxin system AbiEi family antitoxin [Xanthomonas euvesicatoria]|uniref:type IV toxin-antitoxin system AbiEi family antitoxin n=1 Tax=Xanthomonas euvesicatoria TaxID=456327 RepID=UPI001C0B1C8D|nr:hypothetical protein [Xanthomonas euvesicatoria]